jgi:hypothetical protein
MLFLGAVVPSFEASLMRADALVIREDLNALCIILHLYLMA